MKKALLFLGMFSATVAAYAQDCSKIFISEYVEGRGNNKAIEIYNPTNQPVNMSEYFLQRYSNGSTTASAQGTFQAKTVQLTGTIQPYSTLVYVIDLRDPNGSGQTAPIWDELEAKADYFPVSAYDVNNVMHFNGNDALLLAKGNATSPMTGTVIYDIFGKIGEDPEATSSALFEGWTSVAPYNGTSGSPNDRVVTQDHSMLRKAGIKKGFVPNPPFGATFNPLLEWDSIPATLPKTDPVTGEIIYQADGVTPQWVGNWESLRWHNCDCAPLSVGEINLDAVKLYPNPTAGIITLTGVENAVSIEVYNSMGQVVEQMNNNNNQAVVSVNLTKKAGVYMVKISDRNGRSATQRVVVE